MAKKILVVCGSSRKGGNTELLADAFIRGAQQVGHEVHKIALYNKQITPCIDCKYCYNHQGECVFKDDMCEIYEALKETELLVLASPVYFYNFPAKMKGMWDRLHNPIRDQFKVEGMYLLTAYADHGAEVSQPMIETYRLIGSYLGWRDLGILAVEDIEEKGKIVGNKALEKAEALGKGIQ